MYNTRVLAIGTIFIGVLFAFSSCEQSTGTTFEESFQDVKQVTPIPGAQNTKMELQHGDQIDSFFAITLNDGAPKEGWCIEWDENASFGVNEGTKLYSTKGHEEWKELNYFMGIKDDLRAQDPDLTYREIQVVIWSLIDNPSFDVDKIDQYENISERIYKDGQPLFDVQKVKDLIAQVNNYFSSSKFKGDYETLPGLTFIQNDGQTGMVSGDETAFAVKTKDSAVDTDFSTCFDEEIIEDISFQRWGWTNNLTVPSTDNSPLTLTYDVYAGAGQCDLSKGTRVGELDVTLTSDGNLTVTYRMTETSGFTGATYTISETHLYIGIAPYPTGKNGKYTVAPGQYGETQGHHDNVTEVTYEVENLEGSFYFIAHAVVSGFDPDASEAEED